MPESNELVTIRRLPDGAREPARITERTAGQVTISTIGEPRAAFETGCLVEIDGGEGFYLGEVVARAKDSQLLVAVEHFVDRAALAEIESVWKPAGEV